MPEGRSRPVRPFSWGIFAPRGFDCERDIKSEISNLCLRYPHFESALEPQVAESGLEYDQQAEEGDEGAGDLVDNTDMIFSENGATQARQQAQGQPPQSGPAEYPGDKHDLGEFLYTGQAKAGKDRHEGKYGQGIHQCQEKCREEVACPEDLLLATGSFGRFRQKGLDTQQA